MNKKGLLVVFSGPSGVGKGTVLQKYLAGREDTLYSVSATTRKPREGEMHGVHYYFLTKEAFVGRVERGEMLEYAEFAGNFYGTPQKEVDENLSAGLDVVLEIEVQGAMQVKEKRPDAVMVFVMPPSFSELARRLKKRGSEDEKSIRRRLAEAVREIEYADRYDYILVNYDADEAAITLKEILDAAKCSVKYMSEFINEVKDDAKTFHQ